ncbi:MAG: saccharopine dehydrogenase [Granulosicoccus sp.]
MSRALLWLRTEHKPLEQRAAVTPAVARSLIEAGYRIVVETSEQRAIDIAEYAAVGCDTAEAGDWQQAPADAIVIGLKELDTTLGPFRHRHVHFAHAYKFQRGWESTLAAFAAGGGKLYDLEYLVDDQQRRVAAFGYWAGYVGAGLALLALAAQRSSNSIEALESTASPGNTDSSQTSGLLGALDAWPHREALQCCVQQALLNMAGGSGQPLQALVIGARGRSGRGAVDLCHSLGIETTAWDIKETTAGGPFDAILDHDVLINCVFVDQPVPPFTTLKHLAEPGRRLAIVSDVGCDPYGEQNPLPIYNECTTLDNPTMRLLPATENTPPLDLIAIDHLPSLLPLESSEDFSQQLLATLLTIDELGSGAWGRAGQLFEEKLKASCSVAASS